MHKRCTKTPPQPFPPNFGLDSTWLPAPLEQHFLQEVYTTVIEQDTNANETHFQKARSLQIVCVSLNLFDKINNVAAIYILSLHCKVHPLNFCITVDIISMECSAVGPRIPRFTGKKRNITYLTMQLLSSGVILQATSIHIPEKHHQHDYNHKPLTSHFHLNL